MTDSSGLSGRRGHRARAWREPLAAACALFFIACSGDPATKKQKYLESGNRYFAEAKYREAAIEYRNAVQIDPRFAAARVKLAESHAKIGDAPAAMGEYIRAADLLPDDVDIQLTAGTYLLAARRPDDALARADAALRVDPKNIRAHLLRGNALGGLNDLEGAIEEIDEAVRLDPTKGVTLTHRGLIQMARGQRAEAGAAFRRASELAPTAIETHLALAHYYWSERLVDQAERAFRRALEIDPGNLLANRAMASFCLATGRAVEAEKYLKQVASVSRAPGALFALTDYYVSAGRPREAIEQLEPLAAANRNIPGARHRLARAYAAGGDRKRAHGLLDDLLRNDPANAEAQLLKGQFLLEEGRRDEALARVRAAADAAPTAAGTQFALGRIYAARGDNAGAEKAFREVLRLNPSAAAAEVELARLELASGRTQSSVKSAQEALRKEPANRAARLALVRSLLASKELARAEREIATLLAEDPTLAAAHVQAGVLAAERRDTRAAHAAFEHALALDANSLEALAGVVALDASLGDLASARARVDHRLAAGKPSSGLLLVAARTYASANDLPTAERFLLQAIETEPTFLPAYSMLAQIYLKQRRLDEARREFEKLAARQSRPVAALTMAGMILYVQGNFPEARTRFEQALATDPGAAIAGNNLAWMYAEAGENLDTALQLAQNAAAKVPDSPEIADTLGWVYYKKALPELAIAAFARAVERDASNATYQYHLGLAHAQAGDAARARAALERALGSGTDFKGAGHARQVLSRLETGALR